MEACVSALAGVLKEVGHEPQLYAACCATLSQLALPDTYFNLNSTNQSAASANGKDGGGGDSGPATAAGGAAGAGEASTAGGGGGLRYDFNGDDIAITSLNTTFSKGVNDLVKSLIERLVVSRAAFGFWFLAVLVGSSWLCWKLPLGDLFFA